MQYEFSHKWWLRWYWPFIEPLYLVEGHFGTRQSAKSHNIARKLLYHSFKQPKFNVIHSRKVYGEIEGSTFKILTDLIYKHFPNDFSIRKNHFEIVNRHNGNWFRGLGMDKAEKGKGVEGANIAWLNEANQYTLEDREYIDTTLRGNEGVPISLIMDWNPETKNHWLYADYEFLKDKPNHLFHKSLFWDNYTIDREALHEKLLRIKSRGSEGIKRYNVWAKGDWGVEEIEKLFAHSFDSEIHTIKAFIKPMDQFPLVLAFDFNITNSCIVGQFLKNKPGSKYYATINVIKSYRIGDLRALMETVQTEFPRHKWQYIVNGDASGHSGSAFTQDNISAYVAIVKGLKLRDMELQVNASNPSHIQSRHITNLVFQECNVKISEPGNPELIEDLKLAEVDRSGSLEPWKTKNPLKVHLLDCFRYLIYSNFAEIANEYEL